MWFRVKAFVLHRVHRAGHLYNIISPMQLDPAFTQQVQDYLAQPIEQRDLKHGAELMLRLNRNRSLHR